MEVESVIVERKIPKTKVPVKVLWLIVFLLLFCSALLCFLTFENLRSRATEHFLNISTATVACENSVVPNITVVASPNTIVVNSSKIEFPTLSTVSPKTYTTTTSTLNSAAERGVWNPV